MLALHWLRLSADPSWRLGLLTGRDWSGDFFTDEGWEAKAAVRSVVLGQWHAPGELNLAVQSPLWPAILYLPFKLFGVSIGLARGVAATFYVCSVLAAFAFMKRLADTRDALLVAALLSVNVLGFVFGRAALIEPVYLCFVLLGLLIALYAADAASIFLSILAGLCLSLAIVVKLTAVFSLAPFLAILWLRFPRGSRRLVAAIASLISVASLPILQRMLLIARYPLEQQIYLKINVIDREVTGLRQWLLSVAHILVGLRAVGPFLLLSFLVGGAFYLLRRKFFRDDPLLLICLAWLLGNAAILSLVHYFPPRYCLSLLFPITFLAVHFARVVSDRSVRGGAILYVLIALSLGVDCAQDLISLGRSRYTMVTLAEQVRRSVASEGRPSSCAVMGGMGDTLALYGPTSAANIGWGTEPTWKRIEACNPSVFVTSDALTPETREDFLKAGRVLEFSASYAALPGYGGGNPQQLYVVRPLKPEQESRLDGSAKPLVVASDRMR